MHIQQIMTLLKNSSCPTGCQAIRFDSQQIKKWIAKAWRKNRWINNFKQVVIDVFHERHPAEMLFTRQQYVTISSVYEAHKAAWYWYLE